MKLERMMMKPIAIVLLGSLCGALPACGDDDESPASVAGSAGRTTDASSGEDAGGSSGRAAAGTSGAGGSGGWEAVLTGGAGEGGSGTIPAEIVDSCRRYVGVEEFLPRECEPGEEVDG